MNHNNRKYVPFPIRNNNNKRNMGSNECKFCKRVVHLGYCLNNREKNRTGASQTRTKKIWCQGNVIKMID